jgi:hypothetical protein
MHLSSLHNQRNTAVLSSLEFSRIHRNANPPEVDNTLEMDRMRHSLTHEKTLAVVSTWGNSVINERQARITRLERESQERERAAQERDEEERQFQKSKRKECLRQAEIKAFQEKPEIRAVHSQLLLHEVARERQRQILLKERYNRINSEKDDEWAAEEKRRLQELADKDREIARQRRLKAIEVAELFRQQRLEAEDRRMELQGQEIEEEQLLTQEATRLLNAETMQKIKQREIELRNVREAKEANSQLIAWKARDREIARVEGEKIEADKLRRDEEFEAREEADKRRKALRQADINRLIEKQQQTLTELKSQQQVFDDRQYELQYDKDKRAIDEMKEKNDRMQQERRADYLEAKVKLEGKGKKRPGSKSVFPPDERQQKDEDEATQRELQRAQALKDLGDFQRKQMAEKRERELAEKESRRLEYQHQIDLENQRTVEAQEYARDMLVQAKASRPGR